MYITYYYKAIFVFCQETEKIIPDNRIYFFHTFLFEGLPMHKMKQAPSGREKAAIKVRTWICVYKISN